MSSIHPIEPADSKLVTERPRTTSARSTARNSSMRGRVQETVETIPAPAFEDDEG